MPGVMPAVAALTVIVTGVVTWDVVAVNQDVPQEDVVVVTLTGTG